MSYVNAENLDDEIPAANGTIEGLSYHFIAT